MLPRILSVIVISDESILPRPIIAPLESTLTAVGLLDVNVNLSDDISKPTLSYTETVSTLALPNTASPLILKI